MVVRLLARLLGVCLGDDQTEAYLKDIDMTGLASIPWRWPDGGLSEGYGHDGLGVCLGDDQTETYLKDTGMADLVSAWAMAKRRSI